jgi:FKBP-type peptidyl-prolyl cis-trans isomerase
MKPVSDRPKCGNIEECQALAEQKERELIQQQQDVSASATPVLMTTAAGTRYRDLELGSGNVAVQKGDSVEIAYKVLKLGKRSYDGISGEGTTVFSRGYNQDNDEEPGLFAFSVGDDRVITALNDAIVGMTPGGIRRMAIQPDRGWRKPGRECDGGPGGAGTGGELKTDYVVVPTAKLVATETCFDTNKIPFPSSYAQQRRMAQRFDQSLIMEVKLMKIMNK